MDRRYTHQRVRNLKQHESLSTPREQSLHGLRLSALAENLGDHEKANFVSPTQH